jgi:hypothetical protein
MRLLILLFMLMVLMLLVVKMVVLKTLYAAVFVVNVLSLSLSDKVVFEVFFIVVYEVLKAVGIAGVYEVLGVAYFAFLC